MNVVKIKKSETWSDIFEEVWYDNKINNDYSIESLMLWTYSF